MRALTVAAALLVLAGCSAGAAPEEEDGPEFAVGTFEAVPGAGHLRAPLRMTYEGAYVPSASRGSGRATETVNTLFYDVAGREGRWLFPGVEQRILADEAVADSGRVRMLVYDVVEADTDGDERLGHGDAHTIAVSDPTGRRLVRVAEGVDHFRQVRRLDDDTVLVLYDAAGRVGAVEVNVDALTIEAEIAMPPVPEAGA